MLWRQWMKGGILRKGLIVIGACCILVALIWFVVVDLVMKMVIESQGSKAVGAKVDVAEADLALFPASIEILGLEVTDPESPMKNAVAVGRMYSDIELWPLIRRKVIINNLRMESIRLNTPRKTSGALPQYAGSGPAMEKTIPPWLNQMCREQNAPQFTLPKVKDILASEQLQSLQLAEKLRNRIDAAKTQWEERIKKLPTRKDFDAYQARLSKLKSSSTGLTALMGAATEFQALQADLKNDLDKIKQAQKGFKAELNNLKKQSSQLTKAPLEDVQRLKAKYALSPEGAANLSRMLFGPKVCQWWQKGYHWYARLKPYISKETPKNGKQEKPEPEDRTTNQTDDLPDFLIRQAHIDALLDVGHFTGEAVHITSDPKILGKPMTFKFLGRQLKDVQGIDMKGIIDFIKPNNPKHNVKLQVQQLGLQNLNLSDSQTLPLFIAKAMADFNMDLNLTGPKIDALVKAQLDNVRMAIEKTGASELSTALADAIESVTRFGLTAIVKGSDPDYETKIESDLDKVLQKAVSALVQKTGRELESSLRTAITEKSEGAISDARNQLGSLGALGGELDKRLDLGNNLLKSVKLPF